MVQLKQDSGRGVRGSDLPLVGAIITNRPYKTIEQVELGLGFAEGFERMYPIDYRASLNDLSACVASTDPQLKVLNEAVV